MLLLASGHESDSRVQAELRRCEEVTMPSNEVSAQCGLSSASVSLSKSPALQDLLAKIAALEAQAMPSRTAGLLPQHFDASPMC